jgi:predicted AlkP superfamily pyrophosphatase or phosphodiesterase
MKRSARNIRVIFSIVFFLSAISICSAKPKLVISIVVDQMRADYLLRYKDLFTERGFNLFLKEGADFTNCRYKHSETVTGPGHSIVLSGIPPGLSGIISNEWYDKPHRASVYCVNDTTVLSLGIGANLEEGRKSPRNFLGESICDELRAVSPSSKAIGIALKDRAAILPVGQHPTAAYWFDAHQGVWITSNYYMNLLPDWVIDFNRLQMPVGYLGKTWTKLLPESCYVRCGKDDAAGEGVIPGETMPVFPHQIIDRGDQGKAARFSPIFYTPYGNELTIAFAETAIVREKLGMRGVPDILSVSFSAPDFCGHTFGPDSYEVEDMIVQLDRQLEGLFTFLDEQIGLNNIDIVLTGDHGVCPLPEKDPTGKAKRINAKNFIASIKSAAAKNFNYDETSEKLILKYSNSYIYLDDEKIASKGIAVDSFENFIGQASVTTGFIARYFTRNQLEQSIATGGSRDSIQSKVEWSYNPERSGNVALVVVPYSFFSGDSTGTTHGSPYWYDTSVPLLFYGADFTPAVQQEPCSPYDIAPTLAEILKIKTPPNCKGDVLVDVLSKQQ